MTEVGRHSDHGVCYFGALTVLGDLFRTFQNHRRYIGWRVLPAAQDHADTIASAVARLLDSITDTFSHSLDFGVIYSPPHEALDGDDGVQWGHRPVVKRSVANQTLFLHLFPFSDFRLLQTDHRAHLRFSLEAVNYFWTWPIHDSNDSIGRAEINADHLAHRSFSTIENLSI